MRSYVTIGLFLFLSGCSVIYTTMTLPESGTIAVSSYSLLRNAEASYKSKDTQIQYGAQTEAAKIQDFLQALAPLLLAAMKAGAVVPVP